MPDKTFIVRIKRQQRPDESVRWEEYELRYQMCIRDRVEREVERA